MPKETAQRDLKHVWHPCSQMKDYESFPPLDVRSARGSLITLEDGRTLIDAISSWWCKSLGHAHPTIGRRVRDQMERFEHVILANTTHEGIVELSEKLCSIHPALTRVFYACDGSTAVEIALKMSVHAHQHLGCSQREHFAALECGYHGETALTLGVSDCGLYKAPYRQLARQGRIIQNVPTCAGFSDPAWMAEHDFSDHAKQLGAWAGELAAVIVEPIVQGAGGMRIIPPRWLKTLERWCREHGVHLITDEIMTGFGRTGRRLAGTWAELDPDFTCVSKGLTGGFSPLSATLTTEAIYGLFYDDYETGRAFLHSNTFTGHALGIAAALGAWQVYEEEAIEERVPQLQARMRERLTSIAERTGHLENLRGIGGLVAADIRGEGKAGQRRGYAIYCRAVELGALLRPLGDTLYWMPPLNTPAEVIDDLADITAQAVEEILGR